MNTRTNTIRRVVMRRIYTNYAARIVSHPLMFQGAVFATALFVFAELVHVERVVATLQAMPLSNMPNFALARLMDGEVLTLLAVAAMAITTILAVRHLSRLVVPAMQLQRQMV